LRAVYHNISLKPLTPPNLGSLFQLTGIQRSDEDKTTFSRIQGSDEDKADEEDDLSVYKPLEAYKDRLNRKLAEVRKEILEHDIVHELSRDEETSEQKEGENEDDNSE
jgi:hypothetical protein